MSRSCGFAASTDGTEIFFVDYADGVDPGKPAFLLIHGWSASGAIWREPLIAELNSHGHRVVVVDNRGHGRSSVPDPESGQSSYRTAQFAADVDAVRTEAGLRDVVLVGWSYGGVIIADHLAVYGIDQVAGVGLIGALTSLGGDGDDQFPGGVTGPSMTAALPDALSPLPGRAIGALAKIRMLPHGFDHHALGPVAQQQFGVALATPPHVRAGYFRRTVNHDENLAAWDFPVRIVHGTDDDVVSPATARHHAQVLPRSVLSWWEDGGHAPFVLDPARFAAELVAVLH